MNCENCAYCKGGQLPESYEEEWFCEKGYGNPMEDGYCKHLFIFQRLVNFLYYPIFLLKFKRIKKCLKKSI